MFYKCGLSVSFKVTVHGLLTPNFNCIYSVDSCCKSCWDIVSWLDNWKKAVLYLLLSIPSFIQPKEVWLAVIGGRY